MASIASKKVTPINDEAELNENDIIDPADMNAAEPEHFPSAEELNLNVILKRATRRTMADKFFQYLSYITYDNMKEGMRYMLENASFTVTLSVGGSITVVCAIETVPILTIIFTTVRRSHDAHDALRAVR
jgi:hypothetical protein